MGLFSKFKNGGLMDEIRCDEKSYLIWKWHPKGSEKGNNTKENSIRWGSALRVKDGEVAVFVYKQKDGTMQDYIVGPFDEIIKTANFPVLSNIIGLAYDGGTPFQAEIYFINLAQIIQTKFGVPYFDIYDPRFEDFVVPVAVRGTISFKISDYKQFVKLHRLNDFNLEDFQKQISDLVSRYAKDAVSNAPASNNIPLVQIETQIAKINDRLELDIKERLKEDFGVEVSGVDISNIELDKTSDGYRELMNVTKDISTAKAKADFEDYEEKLRIQREEGQYATHKQTQTANIGAYQIEKQAEVAKAGAEALGKMGENGTGNVDLGGNSTGFNPASMMASMAVGGAVGQNIANSMNNIMNKSVDTPPTIPTEEYYIAVDGKSTGPFNIEILKQMLLNGTFTKESLVWKKGMDEWKQAKEVESLQKVFNSIPPIPPQD